MPPSPDAIAPRAVSVAGPVALVAGHLLLGAASWRSGALGTVHGGVCAAALLAAFVLPVRHAVLLALAYTAGAEVYWRMAAPEVPWEWAKYLVAGAALAHLAVARGDRPPGRWALALGAYVACLVPSLLVLASDPLQPMARISDAVRFYLLNPLALAATAAVALRSELSRREWARLLGAWLLGHVPILGVMGMAYLTVRARAGDDLRALFPDDSTGLLTGGFGPNQVSGALGLATLLGILLALDARRSLVQRALALGLALATATGSALTFSRGGLYGAGIALLAALVVLARAPAERRRVLGVVAALGAVAVFVVTPRLVSLTGGMLATRFADTQPTGRDQLVLDDLLIFGAHPVLGVGPGEASEHRTLLAYGIGHTEYTRLLAEHGMPGLVAAVVLVALCVRAWRTGGTAWEHAVRVALGTWAAASLAHLAMRIADVAVALALAQAGAGMLAHVARAARPSHPASAGARGHAAPTVLSTR